ncbi:hypothetical protein CK203_108094 [Vitis vinifera]|uniref:Uncharacterized protein n=1 Tax=Vitis vinifera TaxID=29760 RepID=A0A438BN11_VITVI|nr:hypothetical protein CK203_108094 [Vitis vinifera]
MERKTFLVRFEGESGGKWCSLTEHSRGSVSTLVGRALARRLGQKGVVTIVPFLGRKGLFFVETIEEALSLQDLRFLKIKGGYTIQLRRWSPRENSEVVGKFRGGWIKLRGLPFHLWSEEHLKKMWTVTEIDWQTLKLFDLCKARVRILMKERSVLSALIEVLDGGWVFTISVVVVGVEEVRRGREMGESTREDFVPHSWKCGGRRVERDRSMTNGSSSVRAVGKMKKGGESQKAETIPVGTHGKRGLEVWSELKKLGEVEKWVSQPERILCLTRGHVVEDGLREIDQRLMEVLLLGQLGKMNEGGESQKAETIPVGHMAERTGSAKGFAMKEVNFGSKKLWTTLFPRSFGHRQGFRSRSEPLTHEKPSSNCEAPPKEDAFKGEHRWYEDSVSRLTCCRSSGFRKRCSGKGLRHQEETRNQRKMAQLCGDLWNVGSGKLRDDVGTLCQVSVGNPNLDVVESQFAHLNQMPEGFNPLKSMPNMPNEAEEQILHRGWGSRKKQRVVKDFLRLENPDVVMIQETKRVVCDRRRSSEKLGDSSLTSSMRDFDGFIRDYELLDPPLRNAPFTWSNMQESPVCKRLDQFLYSNEWEHFFPQSLQEVLPRWTLDHWPMVLDTNPFKWGPTPFRFENMWLQHPSFKECFSSWWRGFQGNGWECHKFMRKLQLFKVKLKDWNKDSFIELNKRKKSILNEIANFDVVEQEGVLTSELSAQRALRKGELEELI